MDRIIFNDYSETFFDASIMDMNFMILQKSFHHRTPKTYVIDKLRQH